MATKAETTTHFHCILIKQRWCQPRLSGTLRSKLYDRPDRSAHQPRRPPYTLISLIIFVLLAVTQPYASAETATPSEPITLATIASVTGYAAGLNANLLAMTRFAFDEINANGGLLGRKINLVVLDNKSTPIGSSMAARKAIEMKVPALIGPNWSNQALAVAPIMEKAKIPTICPGATNPEVTVGRKFVFRACFTDSTQGQALANFAWDTLHFSTAAILTNIDEQYSTTLAKNFRQHFLARGGTLPLEAEYRGNATNFATIIAQLKTSSAQIIFVPGYDKDSGLFVRQARKAGITTPILGGDGWDGITDYSGEDIGECYHSAHWHPQMPNDETIALKNRYQKAYNRPVESVAAPLTYDAVMVLAQAIRNAGSFDSLKIRDALTNLHDFHGATGVFSFNATGDPVGKEVAILRYSDGKWRFNQMVHP